MVSQQMLISVALPVAAMAIVVGSVANVQDSTLAPGLDTIDAATQFGYPEVTIDEENELRGVTVFNMLSAQNCLYPTLAFKREGELKQEDEDFIKELEGDYQPLKKVEADRTDESEFYNGEGLKTPYELNHGEFTYYNHGDVLRDAMDLEGFNGACLGGKQLSLTAPLKEHYEYLAKAASAADTALYLMQPWEWQIGEGADNEELNRGALQGRYGRIEFEMNDTVLIDDPRLMGIKFPEATVDSGAGADNAPDFIRGRRAAAFLPEGYLRGDAAGTWDEDPGAIAKKASLGMKVIAGTTAGYAGATAGVAVGSTIGSMVATFAIGGSTLGPAGSTIGAGIGLVVGTSMAVYAVMKTTQKVDEIFSIGSHPAVLLGIDQPIGITDTSIWSGTGMFKYHERDNVEWREDLNAFRVRMVNVPIVMDPSFFPDVARTRNEAGLQMGYNYITSKANYVICNQSEGFIQSNAGEEIEYDGKKKYQNDPPIFRDVVYPRIELSKRDATCLSDAYFKSSSEYNIVKEIRAHQEFLDDNENFRGPVSTPIGVFTGVPIREMRDDDEITTETMEDVLVLSPDKRADLTQGLTRISISDDIEWWDRPRGVVYQTTFGATDSQCNDFDGKHEVTRMFTDNRYRSDIYETGYGDIDEEDIIYREKEAGDDYQIELPYNSAKGSELPITYNFGRFSSDSKFVLEFDLDLDVEDTESKEYQNLVNEEAAPVALFTLAAPNRPRQRLWFGVFGDSVRQGGGILSEDELPRSLVRGKNTVDKATVNMDDMAREKEGWSSGGDPSIERDYRFVIDKETKEILLEGEFGEGTEDSSWITLTKISYSEDSQKMDWLEAFFDNTFMSIDEIETVEILTNKPDTSSSTSDTGMGMVPEDVAIMPSGKVTIKEATVDGTIAGCP